MVRPRQSRDGQFTNIEDSHDDDRKAFVGKGKIKLIENNEKH